LYGCGRILASAGARWKAVLIEAGRSKNGVLYTADELRRAVSARLFEGLAVNAYPAVDTAGRPIFATSPYSGDHVRDEGLANRTAMNQVGVVRNATWNDAARRVEGEVELFEGLPLGKQLQQQLEALRESNALDSIGLSIDGDGPLDMAGRASIRSIHHVAVVSRPAAGGAISHRIAASAGGPIVTVLQLLRTKYPRLAEGLADNASDFATARHLSMRAKADEAAAGELATAIGKPADAKRLKESAEYPEVFEHTGTLLGSLRESIAHDEAEAKRIQKERDDATAATARLTESERLAKESKDQMQALRVEQTELRVERAITGASLPEPVATRLRESFKGQVADQATVDAAVSREKKYVDDLAAKSAFGGVQVIRESADRTVELLSHVLNPHQVPAPKEGVPAYAFDGVELFQRHITGGVRLVEAVYGGDSGRRRLRESIDSTTSVKTLQDAMNIALLAAYVGHHAYDGWKKITRTVYYPNFRTNHVVKVPYYGNLPAVAKGAPYVAITTTTETEETISLAKYGGTENITLEDVLNGDFVDLWQQRLRRLGQAAMETRSELVHYQHRDATMPTLAADSKTLTDATRSPANEGTSVMSATLATAIATVMEAITGMMAATGGSGVAKGVIPKFIVLPKEKVGAYNAVLSSLGGASALDFQATVKRMGWFVPEPIIDLRTTNTTDHYFFADPNEAEVLRVGELVGRNGPRITIADQLSVGAMFTNDRLEARIDDVFSVAAVDSVGIYGNDAAS
jgi:hypothetical protein